MQKVKYHTIQKIHIKPTKPEAAFYMSFRYWSQSPHLSPPNTMFERKKNLHNNSNDLYWNYTDFLGI